MIGLQRTTQLINKTNQFNLTTCRYSEIEVEALISDPSVLAIQLRLVDRFGDNGIISVVICKQSESQSGDWIIDTWLMSCRVLGRRVERTTLSIIANETIRRGARRLIGLYRPTKKNKMVADHYLKLGFSCVDASDDGANTYALELERFVDVSSPIKILEG